jgi:hypothetical protein
MFTVLKTMNQDVPSPASKAFLTSLQETCCNQEVTCPITFDIIPIGEGSITLPCGHIFSPSAIKTWLSEKSHQCPVCRQSYEKEPISVFELDRNDRQSPLLHPFGTILGPDDLLRAVSIIHEQDNDDQVNAAISTIPVIQEMIRESESTIWISDSDSDSTPSIQHYHFCD